MIKNKNEIISFIVKLLKSNYAAHYGVFQIRDFSWRGYVANLKASLYK